MININNITILSKTGHNPDYKNTIKINCVGKNQLRFTIGKNIIEQLNLHDNDRVSFGVDKLNNQKLYLIITNKGNSIAKYKNYSLCSFVSPFGKFESKIISNENIIIHKEHKIIEMHVKYIFELAN